VRILFQGVEGLVWLVLVSATGLSWWLGADRGLGAGTAPATVTGMILLVAFIKVRLVIRHFMEIRRAPLVLKLLCDAWILIVATTIMGLYLFA